MQNEQITTNGHNQLLVQGLKVLVGRFNHNENSLEARWKYGGLQSKVAICVAASMVGRVQGLMGGGL